MDRLSESGAIAGSKELWTCRAAVAPLPRTTPPRPDGRASLSPDPASPAARDLRGCTLPFARRFSLRRRLHPRENAATLAARRGEMRNGSRGACARRTGRAGRGSARPNRGAAHFPYACNPLSGDPRGSALMQPWDLRRYPAMLARVSQGKADRVWPRSHAERPPLHALAGTRGRNRASRGRAPGR